MKKLLFFVNPKAGQGTQGFNLVALLQEFAAAGYRTEVYLTQRPGDLTEVIAREGWKYDLIVSSGGDGTLNETTSGLMQLPEDRRPLLGYIPRGTVNDVSFNLGLSKQPLKAVRDILSGNPLQMDVGRCNDRWFNYVAAFGMFTDVSYRTPQEEKRILGRLAYFLDGAKRLSDIRRIRVRLRVNGQELEETVLVGLVTSTTSVGGFRVGNENDVDYSDGLFEVLLVRELNTPARLQAAVSGLLRRDFSGDCFYFCKASHAEFYFDTPEDWTTDGEHAGCFDRVFVDNFHRAVTIQIPGDKGRGHSGRQLIPAVEKKA